jgi:hypothetical protein
MPAAFALGPLCLGWDEDAFNAIDKQQHRGHTNTCKQLETTCDQ